MRVMEAPDMAAQLHASSRILVIGCSGGGKSTLAMRLSRVLGLPFVSMDREFYWLPDWARRDRDAARAMIAEAVSVDAWIMDGTGVSSFDLRAPRAQSIIWVRMPRWLCLWGVFTRKLTHFGRTRPEMAEGCTERLPDREFLSFIWNFDNRTTPRIRQSIDRYAPDCPVLILSSRGEMRALLKRLGT